MNFQTAQSIASQIQHPKFSKDAFLNHVSNKEYLIQALVNKKFDEEAFHAKVTGFTTNLADVVPNAPIELKVGDLVTYTNEYGASFVNNKILGFDLNPSYNRVVYIDSSSYWFAVEIASLTVQEGYVGVDANDMQIAEMKYQNSSIPFDVQMIRSKQQAA